QQETQIPSFSFNDPGSQYDGNAARLEPNPFADMNGNVTLPPRTDSMMASHAAWTVPTSQGLRPRPATIHEGFSFCVGGGFEGLPAWDPSSLQMQPPTTAAAATATTTSDTVSSRPVSVHQDFYPATTMENGECRGGRQGAIDDGLTVIGSDAWAQKPCDGNLEMSGLEPDMIGQAYTTDEAIPILDLRSFGPSMDGDSRALDGTNQRRMSGSSFTLSTTGGLSEITSYEDFSAALSDAPSLSSDYPPPSNRTSMISSTHLSPVASPRMTPHSRSELVRTQSRGRASPSPRPGVRAVPYSVEGARNKRWSTGSYGTASSNRRPSPFVYHHPHDAFNLHARLSSSAAAASPHHSSPTIAQGQLPLSFGNLQAAQQHHPYLYGPAPAFQHVQQQHNNHNHVLVPSQLPSNAFPPESQRNPFENPPPPLVLSHGLFRMLQSNADPHSLPHGHYADLSDPPDLYASLHEEQIPPPPEDMNPEDEDLVPHEQELRFEGDLYTPRWVRGHGNKREGWCGICKPGRWLVLKNSAFWYDKSFTHGISAATGSPFQEPRETRRMDGNPDVWEGLCGSCNEWIALVSSKKKGTTWFRHAYKCHTHPKIKDAPKRKREGGGGTTTTTTRVLPASTMAKPRTEPLTPQMTPATSSTADSLRPRHTPSSSSSSSSQEVQQQQDRQQAQETRLQPPPVPPPVPPPRP
ncbi:uncharacterized protein P884DRAFT_177932, partial [Thermothelomyces heterothallicus CBS 202.75]|uniref:uncharacterized protein n=1 Tax=Thermothelomyces heterothallicus CBS 202.75 TaxID=1149848 RepID=UPI003744296A